MITEGLIETTGAKLYYQVRGSGPLLLVIQGGAADADGSDALATRLESNFMVVSYDRRGLSRSAVVPGSEPTDLSVHGSDAAVVLRELTDRPAYVFGVSIGALIGLDLVTRYPDAIRVLVAHEAPATQLLAEPEREQAIREQEEVEAAFRNEGVRAALMRFLRLSGVDFADREEDAPAPASSAFMAANLEFFLTYDAPAVRRYHLDEEALKRQANRVVPAAGASSSSHWPHHCASCLAELLGVGLVEFPGGHNAYGSRPKAVAQRLRQVLRG